MASCTCDRADCYNCVFERGYQLGLNAYILDTDRSHPMTANPKPLLTRREIDELYKYDAAATPAPWKMQSDGMTVRQDIGEEKRGKRICVTGLALSPLEEIDVDNLELIAVSRNALPTALSTIERMAELLERWQKSQTPTTRMLISRQELESLWMETNQTVQTFNATGGEGS